jgi:hypothetical protein
MSIHSYSVDRLLDSIENSMDNIIQREGGSRANIVGPELGNGREFRNQTFYTNFFVRHVFIIYFFYVTRFSIG